MVSPLEIRNMKEFYRKKMCNPPSPCTCPLKISKQGLRIWKACMLNMCSRRCKEKQNKCYRSLSVLYTKNVHDVGHISHLAM